MATTSTPADSIRTLADLLDRLGGVALERVRSRPFPGTATVQDVIAIHDREGRLCELVDGVLVEKTFGFSESVLAAFLAGLLNAFVIPRNLGIVTGPDGMLELVADVVRAPDVAFISWDRMPGGRRPTHPVPLLAPNLAAEILSRSNTPREMETKRRDYFRAGVELVWEADPQTRTIAVYTSEDQVHVLSGNDVLEGGTVLPGFTLPLAQLFGELDRCK